MNRLNFRQVLRRGEISSWGVILGVCRWSKVGKKALEMRLGSERLVFIEQLLCGRQCVWQTLRGRRRVPGAM